MTSTSDAPRFVARFADFWQNPSVARLPDLLHRDVVLVQPLAPRTVGIEAAQQQFHRFCSCLPELSADVDHWSGDSDMVFIEFRLRAKLGHDVLEWPSVNRIRLCDGKESNASPTSTLWPSCPRCCATLQSPGAGTARNTPPQGVRDSDRSVE